MVINLGVVALFIVNFILRWQGATNAAPFLLTVLAVLLLLVSGWLGGEMVFRHGVAQAGPPAISERRRARTPVSNERRHPGTPLGQH